MRSNDRVVPRFGAAIFDLDGTLLDTLASIGNAANRVLSSVGRSEFPISDFRFLVGDGVYKLFERALGGTGDQPALVETCVERFHMYYGETWRDDAHPYDGIVHALTQLNNAGLKIAVLSNKPDTFTKSCVTHFLKGIEFEAVVGHKPPNLPKPDPTGVFEIAERLRLDTGSIGYIGDTNTDMETAVRSGCFAIGVSWGFRSVEELANSGARVIIDHPDQLLPLLLGE